MLRSFKQSRPLRPVLLSSTLQCGGADMSTLSMLGRLPNANPVAYVLSTKTRCNPWLKKRAEAVVPIIADDNPREALRKACQRGNVLITWHCSNLPELVEGLDIPILLVSHSSYENNFASVPGSIWTSANYLAAVSRTAARVFPARAGVVTVLYGGVDPSRVTPYASRSAARSSLGYSERDRILLYVGRLAADKRPELLLDALYHLPENWKVLYCGDTHTPEQTLPHIEHIAAKQFPGRIAVLDWQEHLGDLYAAADVACLPSPNEGFGLVMVEAWMTGTPMIVCDHACSRELHQKHGELSYTIPVAATGKQLAEACLTAYDGGRQAERVKQAKEVAWAEYTLSAMTHRWASYLTEIVCDWTTSANYPAIRVITGDA